MQLARPVRLLTLIQCASARFPGNQAPLVEGSVTKEPLGPVAGLGLAPAAAKPPLPTLSHPAQLVSPKQQTRSIPPPPYSLFVAHLIPRAYPFVSLIVIVSQSFTQPPSTSPFSSRLPLPFAGKSSLSCRPERSRLCPTTTFTPQPQAQARCEFTNRTTPPRSPLRRLTHIFDLYFCLLSA